MFRDQHEKYPASVFEAAGPEAEGEGVKVLTVEGVDPSGDPLQDGVLHFPPPHTLDAQVLEAADDNNSRHVLDTSNWRSGRVAGKPPHTEIRAAPVPGSTGSSKHTG